MGYIGTKPSNSPLTSELIPDGIITANDLSTGHPTWDSSGNLGIGTSSIANKLVVSASNPTRGLVQKISNSGASGLTGAQLHFEQNTIGDWVVGQPAGVDAFAIWNNRYPAADGTERMRIDSSGNLLLGSTNSPAYAKFLIVQAASDPYARLARFETVNSGTIEAIQFVKNSGGLAQVGSITMTTTATAYNTSSDYRLKENVVPMTGALAKVSALKPVTYTWKEDGSSGQGFIAHELQEVIPDAVTGEKDAVNEDGTIKAQGIDTSFLVATLTAAIQEQQAIITELKTRIEALEQA